MGLTITSDPGGVIRTTLENVVQEARTKVKFDLSECTRNSYWTQFRLRCSHLFQNVLAHSHEKLQLDNKC